MRKILGFIAVAAVAAGIGLSAVPAWAADPIPPHDTNTVLRVGGHASNFTIDIGDTQYPGDVAPLFLSAVTTYMGDAGPTSVPTPTSWTFKRDGVKVTGSSSGLKDCVTTFRADYAGKTVEGVVYEPSFAAVTVTLVGKHCPAVKPDPEPDPSTSDPKPSESTTNPRPTWTHPRPVNCRDNCPPCPTDCSPTTPPSTTPPVTATVTEPGTDSTTVVYVQQPVEVVRVSSSGTGSPQFTG